MTEIGRNFNLDELRVFADTAKAKRDTALDNLSSANSTADSAAINKTNAETLQTQAQDAKTAADNNEAEAKAAKEKEDSDVQAAMQVINSINSKINVLSFRYTSILSQLNVLSQDSEKNSEQIKNLNEQLNELNEEIIAAKEELAKATLELEREKTEAEEALTNVQIVESEAKEAAINFVKAESEFNESVSNLEKAEEDVAKADEEVKLSEEEYAEAQANYDNAVKETENNSGAENIAHLSEQEAMAAGYTIIPANISGDELINLLSSNLDGKFIMMGDIDLSGINWTPIGDPDSPFKGEFNGNGFDIDNLKITNSGETQNVGFFAVTENAKVTNVNFVDAKIETSNDIMTGSSFVGVVAGLARGTDFSNITVSGNLTGYEGVGGLAGKLDDNDYLDKYGNLIIVNNSAIKNVQTDVDINSSFYTGGLVGFIEGTQTSEGVATKFMTIDNCSTSGSAVISEESCGGFIGEAGKTIITINGCTSSMDLTWANDEDDSNMSFLMETGRIGGIIGNASGTYLTLVGNEYTGKINADGDFQGPQYGWYMNDAQITIYDIKGGLPVDDILNIQGIDALTPVMVDGVPHYEVTVSTLTGLDKMVTMIQDNPSLADLVTFNVNFDFEAMDGMYDVTIYAQYGVIQHLYEDEEGNIVNDVYIDNEIDLETTFRGDFVPMQCCDGDPIELPKLKPTMVSGLYKNSEDEYVVITGQGIKNVDLNFNYENQKTNITKRLTTSETKYREMITLMVEDYRCQMHLLIKRLLGVGEDYLIPTVNKAE